jgi:hypothetical protein
MSSRPRVAAVGCGGTISSLGRDRTNVLAHPELATQMPIAEELQRLDNKASASTGCCDAQHLPQTAKVR